MGLLRKADKRIAGGALTIDVVNDPLVSEYPVLWAFLTDRTWEDGSPRDPGSMLIFEQDGMLKGMLKDRNDSTCLWIAAKGLSLLLLAIEAALCDPAMDWRMDRQSPGQKATRVRKS